MRRVLRICSRLLVLALIVVLLAAASGYLYLRRSLPQVTGTIMAAGLSAPVEIIRDVDAVPHIYAQHRLDALFGLGYVHAQDRLWQLEFQRRVGQGRLAEVLGADALSTDRFLRTLGSHRAAQRAWDSFTPADRQPFESYVAGINAFIAGLGRRPLPPEFVILGAKPQLWTPVDVLTWGKMVAFDLGDNYSTELLRSSIMDAVGLERAQQLMPGWQGGESIVTSLGSTTAYPRLLQLGEDVRTAIGQGNLSGEIIGSNNWVVDGTKSTTGKPLLANDPHLASGLPSTWYLAHLSAGNFEVIGATMPGLPAVFIGHNRTIAWGVTNMNPDVQDLYRERLDSTGLMAEYQGQMEPLQIITETIQVKDQASVDLRVRMSRHGPLLSDVLNEQEVDLPPEQQSAPLEPLALRWTALDLEDRTMHAFLGINEAQNWEDFRAALRDYVAPAQNFVYADSAGNIGYYAPGRIPLRASGIGAIPAEGWTGQQEWIGFVPFDELPHVYNPPSHLIVTANNQPTGDDYPYFLSQEWAPSFRADRITALLGEKTTLSPDDMAKIQADTLSVQGRALLDMLLALVTPATDTERQAVEILRSWDGDASRDSVAQTIYAAWFRRLPRALAGDELGPSIIGRYESRNVFISTFLPTTLAERANPWCDDVATSGVEDCTNVAEQTLRVALADLSERMGSDINRWRWEKVHVVGFNHQPLGNIPILQRIFNRTIPNGGDGNTINPGGFSFQRPFRQGFIPGYRQIIDLASSEGGRFIQAIGQSGNVFSPHYDDYMVDWQAVRYRPMRFERSTVEQAQRATLWLEPQP